MHLFNKCHCCHCSEFNLSLQKAESRRKKLLEDSIRREILLSSFSEHPPPGCVWAQSSTQVTLSICLTDVRDQIIKLEASKLFFKAVGGSDSKCYQVEMEFFKPIDLKVCPPMIFWSINLGIFYLEIQICGQTSGGHICIGENGERAILGETTRYEGEATLVED